MKWLNFLLAIYFCAGIGPAHAQTSLGDANATSSLIFPRAFLKEQEDRQKEGDSAKGGAPGDNRQVMPPGDSETPVPSDNGGTPVPSDNGGTPVPSDNGGTPVPSDNGGTPVPSDNGGTIEFNTVDGSVKGSYFFHAKDSPWRGGLELQGKAINGYASLFASQDISSDAGVHAFVIYSPSVNHWLLARGGYRHGEYKFVKLESGGTVPVGIREEKLHGPSAFLHYNALWRKQVLTGFAVGYARQSNYRALPQVEVTTATPAPSGSTMPTVEKTSIARDGDYETFGTVSGHADLIWVPQRSKHTAGLGVFLRYTRQFSETRRHRVEPGAGLFYLGDLTEKNGDPEKNSSTKAEPEENFFSKITGGITVQWRQDPETGRYDLRFGLVTGYNF